ncbi:MAG TPA: CDP-alcohol phosphatidyltransferase family protein [Prolixibacteraceae bacterium]|nr:CDP-alcohol phosphatidyltransferase family protein [Prolixibacteraceae bacterium]HPS12157.1 CDP-alcohol phosphatidyltransferase family protein [Prolixibacteraceae bacterium]
METNKPKSTITFKDSLKSWDTENYLDRFFYRPVGFKIAMLLSKTPIVPNTVTVISIFFGVGGCLLFYPDNLLINMVGFALLVMANILDCVDGQLSRITGIKSEIGRILDGFSGDLWFLTFYIVISLRLINFEGWGWWTFLIALLSGFSHFTQAGMIDHYKTLHLHFLKNGKNSEFENSKSIQAHSRSLTWKQPVAKIFFRLYYIYTLNQEFKTPQLRKYMESMDSRYPDGYPDNQVAAFRSRSLKLMPLLDFFTFNSRSMVMLVTLILNLEWLYFAVEILVFNPLLIIAIIKHEKMCKELNQ